MAKDAALVAVGELAGRVQEEEARRRASEQQRDRLLEALKPFMVDLGVGCGFEALEHIRETAEEIEKEMDCA